MRTHVLWLLAAELRKLIRPLVWGTGLAIIGFCLLITWGGEWGSRTIRQLLSKQGRRTRVLTAKWLTIWAAGVAAMVCCWLVLAAAAPVIAAAAGLPAAHASAWAGLGSSASAIGRAVVVLGLFAVVGTAA